MLMPNSSTFFLWLIWLFRVADVVVANMVVANMSVTAMV